MARNREHSELKAGVFVVAALAAALGVVLWLGAADVLATKGQLVSFYVPQDAPPPGIQEGSAVLYGGGEIGKVIEVIVQPAEGRCLYRARLNRTDIQVKSDAKVSVYAPPIGAASVVLNNPGSKVALADDENPVALSGGLAAAIGDIASAAENIKAISDTLRQEMDAASDTAVLHKVHGIVDDLQASSRRMVGIFRRLAEETDPQAAGSLMAKVHSTADTVRASAENVEEITKDLRKETDCDDDKALLAKVHRSVDDVNAITADAKPKLQRTMTAVADTAEQIREYAKNDVADILAKLREANTEILKISKNFAEVSDASKKIVVLNKDNIDATLDNMRQVSDNLKAASKDIRRNPWRLIHKPDRQEVDSQNLYDAARAFSEGAGQLDAAIEKLTALQKTGDGVAADDPELQKIRESLMKTFSRFKKAEDFLWKEMGE